MSRNFWKWTAPIVWVTVLGWSYAQDSKVEPTEKKPGLADLQAAPSLDPLPGQKGQPSDSFLQDSPTDIPVGDIQIQAGVTSAQQPHVRQRVIQRSVPYTVKVQLTDEEIAQQHDYLNAITRLRSDESNAEAKQQAREKLTEILKQRMATDLETRTQEVTTLEERVRKLRSQFDNRKAKQDQIIDLRMTTIQNEIDGLETSPLHHSEVFGKDFQYIELGPGPLGEGAGVAIRRSESAGSGPITIGGAADSEGGMGFGLGRGMPRTGAVMFGEPGRGAGVEEEDEEGMQSRPARYEQRYRNVTEVTYEKWTPEEIAEREKYESVLKVLRSEEGEDKKPAARDALRQILVQIFQRDLDSREKDLTELEARVKKLRSQLDKRVAAQAQILKLKMARIQNQIDGLDFNEFPLYPSVEAKEFQPKPDPFFRGQ